MSVIELDHPLIEHKLAILRDEKTGTKEFRELIGEIASVLCYEAMKDVKLKTVEIKTPIEKMKAKKLEEDNYAFVPILRAGMGMLDGVISVIPNAKIGHIGMYRNEETFEPVNYFFKVPKGIEKREVFLLDPMLATGMSMEVGYKALLGHGTPSRVHIACVIGTTQALDYLAQNMPEDTTVWCAAVDPVLNEKKYIVPGLGDAGDLCFGVKL